MEPGVNGTAGALLVDPFGRVLFGRRAAWKRAWPGCWDAIGGRIEPGETAEAAVVREVFEEVGVTATRCVLLAVVPEARPDLHGEASHHIFAVTAWSGGEPTMTCDEHTELRWVSLRELAALSPLAGAGYPELAAQAVAARRPPGGW
jgi:8-oxo-dGTP diphosphatase